MNIFRNIILPVVLLLSSFSAGAEEKEGPSPNASWRNDFSRPDTLETEWQFDGSKLWTARTRFFVADEPSASGGKAMVIEADSATGVMLTHPKGVDLAKTPIMRWRWRLIRPVALAEEAEEPDDQAVVLYFGDGSLFKQNCVGYRWEVESPIGASSLLKYGGGMMTVKRFCVQNRDTPLNRWIVEERDVAADYEAAFGRRPKEYFLVSVGANSQYSGSDTRAEIDFIEFVPRKTSVEEARK